MVAPDFNGGTRDLCDTELGNSAGINLWSLKSVGVVNASYIALKEWRREAGEPTDHVVLAHYQDSKHLLRGYPKQHVQHP